MMTTFDKSSLKIAKQKHSAGLDAHEEGLVKAAKAEGCLDCSDYGMVMMVLR